MSHDIVYADADDRGLGFILPSFTDATGPGGLARQPDVGHFSAIVGRGGSGKSILALQLVTALLERTERVRVERGGELSASRPDAAFYFTLEASPAELLRQVQQFKWGRRYGDSADTTPQKGGVLEKTPADGAAPRASGEDRYTNGLYLVRVPSPVEGLGTIFVDGGSLPAGSEPTWNGYSVGRWDGDGLGVDSNGFRDDTWIDRNGGPLSSAARFAERFLPPAFGHLEIQITVDDPRSYAPPWTTLPQNTAVDTELLDYHCNDNEKDIERLVAH